jgi:hypothetical protein
MDQIRLVCSLVGQCPTGDTWATQRWDTANKAVKAAAAVQLEPVVTT